MIVHFFIKCLPETHIKTKHKIWYSQSLSKHDQFSEKHILIQQCTGHYIIKDGNESCILWETSYCIVSGNCCSEAISTFIFCKAWGKMSESNKAMHLNFENLYHMEKQQSSLLFSTLIGPRNCVEITFILPLHFLLIRHEFSSSALLKCIIIIKVS